MERTLILLKPDAIAKGVCGRVIDRFEAAGLKVRGCKMMHLSPEILREHYAHITTFPFYPDVEAFMRSLPVIALVLEGENCIALVRDMLGVTDCAAAAPGSIRAEFGNKEPGKSKMLNIAHASDSAEAAIAEVDRFFAKDELFAY